VKSRYYQSVPKVNSPLNTGLLFNGELGIVDGAVSKCEFFLFLLTNVCRTGSLEIISMTTINISERVGISARLAKDFSRNQWKWQYSILANISNFKNGTLITRIGKGTVVGIKKIE